MGIRWLQKGTVVASEAKSEHEGSVFATYRLDAISKGYNAWQGVVSPYSVRVDE